MIFKMHNKLESAFKTVSNRKVGWGGRQEERERGTHAQRFRKREKDRQAERKEDWGGRKER